MKKGNNKVLMLLLFWCMLTGGFAGLSNESEYPAKDNLVLNGGFENEMPPEAKLPSKWKYMWGVAVSPEHCAISPDTEKKYEGRLSLKMVLNPPDKGSAGGIWQNIFVDPAQRYTFSCAVRSELEKGGICFSVRWLDSKGKIITNEKNIQITHDKSIYGSFKDNQNPEWQVLKFEGLVPPANAVIAAVGIFPVSCGGVKPAGTVWLDDCNCQAIKSAD